MGPGLLPWLFTSLCLVIVLIAVNHFLKWIWCVLHLAVSQVYRCVTKSFDFNTCTQTWATFCFIGCTGESLKGHTWCNMESLIACLSMLYIGLQLWAAFPAPFNFNVILFWHKNSLNCPGWSQSQTCNPPTSASWECHHLASVKVSLHCDILSSIFCFLPGDSKLHNFSLLYKWKTWESVPQLVLPQGKWLPQDHTIWKAQSGSELQQLLNIILENLSEYPSGKILWVVLIANSINMIFRALGW